jgi:hypothetical protein
MNDQTNTEHVDLKAHKQQELKNAVVDLVDLFIEKTPEGFFSDNRRGLYRDYWSRVKFWLFCQSEKYISLSCLKKHFKGQPASILQRYAFAEVLKVGIPTKQLDKSILVDLLVELSAVEVYKNKFTFDYVILMSQTYTKEALVKFICEVWSLHDISRKWWEIILDCCGYDCNCYDCQN